MSLKEFKISVVAIYAICAVAVIGGALSVFTSDVLSWHPFAMVGLAWVYAAYCIHRLKSKGRWR